MANAAGGTATEQVLVRLSQETYAALQVAQPFVRRRSMQDLVSSIVEEFLSDLRRRDIGFEKALTGLAESRAQDDGTLARRRAGKQQVAGTP